MRLGRAYTNVVRRAAHVSLPPDKTITLKLYDEFQYPLRNLSGLVWSWYDTPLPIKGTSGVVVGGNSGGTDNFGVLVIHIPESSLTSGQVGCLTLSSSTGDPNQTPVPRFFFGPVRVD